MRHLLTVPTGQLGDMTPSAVLLRHTNSQKNCIFDGSESAGPLFKPGLRIRVLGSMRRRNRSSRVKRCFWPLCAATVCLQSTPILGRFVGGSTRTDRIILWHDRVIDQRGPGRAYDLKTGEPITLPVPVTGQPWTWGFTKGGHFCSYAIASEHLLTFRGRSAAFVDMHSGGTSHLMGFRSGCRNSLIPANGVLNAPNFSKGCI